MLAAPTNLALVQGTTQQPSVPFGDPVRAERADIYDVGVVQQVLPGLEVGVDAYYKRATNLIDDGQFGQAFVLTAFNYAQGENVGVELSAKYKSGGLPGLRQSGLARQKATDPVSNQFLFDNATPLPDSRRPDRVPIPADPLGLYRSFTVGPARQASPTNSAADRHVRTSGCRHRAQTRAASGFRAT